eukprot:2547047-Rhodomonas_salina.1
MSDVLESVSRRVRPRASAGECDGGMALDAFTVDRRSFLESRPQELPSQSLKPTQRDVGGGGR